MALIMNGLIYKHLPITSLSKCQQACRSRGRKPAEYYQEPGTKCRTLHRCLKALFILHSVCTFSVCFRELSKKAPPWGNQSHLGKKIFLYTEFCRGAVIRNNGNNTAQDPSRSHSPSSANMPLPYVGFRMSTHETDSIDTS